MKFKTIHIGICALVLIAFLCCAGCTSQPAGNTPVQQPAATQSQAAAVPTAANANPQQTAGANVTPDPWAHFVAPPDANASQGVVTGIQTTVTTALPVETITEIVTPTPVPTAPSVNDTCSNIGGNLCQANEVCSGAFIRTTDVPNCCAGVCQGT
jgi:hypothetical protein